MTIQSTQERLRPILAELAVVAERVAPEQAQLPTPCERYDVTALEGHIVGWLDNFADGFAAPDHTCPRPTVEDVRVPVAQVGQAVRTAADKLDRAVAAGGAEHDLVIQGQGGMPGELALGMMQAEYLIHGWDLATATGNAWRPDEAACTESLEFLRGMVPPESRGPDGMFGPEVPVAEDAAPLERLIGFAGRNPGWRAHVE